VSLDFKAIFGLGAEYRGIDWLRDELAREPAPLRDVVERYRARWTPTAWTVEKVADGMGQVLGPGGFALTISERAVERYHVLRCSHFTGVEEERDMLRGACAGIGRLVGSPRVLYMHELLPSGFHDGKDLDGIEATLRASFGPPSPTLAALHEADDYGPGCWYIELF